jgi:hypothetical protein
MISNSQPFCGRPQGASLLVVTVMAVTPANPGSPKWNQRSAPPPPGFGEGA